MFTWPLLLIPLRSSSSCALGQGFGTLSTTVQIHRNETVEEYSIPIPQDGFESEDFELVREHVVQDALAWINRDEGPQNLTGEIHLDVQVED